MPVFASPARIETTLAIQNADDRGRTVRDIAR
jgi:hypothetical protein